MLARVFSVQEGVLALSRVRTLSHLGQRVSVLEVAVLLAMGVLAALSSAFLNFNLRIPGHAILRAVFPMALGIALVPRRGGGVLMAGSALATAAVMRGLGHGMGTGALTSLGLIGPLLDLALFRARRGWHVYAGFILAGLLTNLGALVIRGGFKALLFDVGTIPFEEWRTQAAITYPVCGILAGLTGAGTWFRLRSRQDSLPPHEPPT